MCGRIVLVSAIVACAAGLLITEDSPDSLSPAACAKVTCADIDCMAPFKLKRSPGQCCYVCHASDEDVALDRHTAMSGPSPYAANALGGDLWFLFLVFLSTWILYPFDLMII